jgi:hypothetical protein
MGNKGYLRNKNLKPVGIEIQFTEEQVKEYLKCSKDPIYFAKKYVKVVTLDKGVTNFNLYDYQQELIKLLKKERFVITKLPRQSGKTVTVGCCYVLHKILFNQSMKVGILANKSETAREILSKIKQSYEHLPWWLQQGVVEWNKGTIELENGSKVIAGSTTSNSVRGFSFNCIAGSSVITIRDSLTGEIFDIPIEELYANSSRNILNYKYFHENDRKQIQEMVFFADEESKESNISRRNYRKTSHNTQIVGGGEHRREFSYSNDSGTYDGASASLQIFNGFGQNKNGSRLIQNGKWETGKNDKFIRSNEIGSNEKLFRSMSNKTNWEKTFGSNQTKNGKESKRKNFVGRGKNENQYGKFWKIDWDKKASRIWTKNIEIVEGEKEDGRTHKQNKQESRKNHKNSKYSSWNETLSRSKRKNENISIKSNKEKWGAVEQRDEICRWEVYTKDGFKSFRGISKTINQKTLKLTFSNNTEIICTPDHKIHTDIGFIEAKNLSNKHKISINGSYTSLKNIQLNGCCDVYDLLDVQDVHSFYANGVLVHNCIVLDEFAHVSNNVASEFFTSVYPVITAGQDTQMIVISTPNGLNLFYQMWKAAISKKSDYVHFEVDWRKTPQYPGGPLRDDVWKVKQIANTSERQFESEFSCSFQGSSNTLIDANKLNELNFAKPKFINGDGLSVYYDPIKKDEEKGTIDHIYFMTVDVSRGQNQDYSAFVLVDITTMPYKVVATFKNNLVSPLLLPSYVKTVAKKYNNAYVLVETNDVGSQVADILHTDLEYENLIKSNYKGAKGQVITEFRGTASNLGVRTTLPVKKLGCSVLKNLIESDKLLVDDVDIISELTTFIADGKSYKADEGHNDDLVMCLVLFSWATRQTFFENLNDKDVRIEMFKNEILHIETELLTFYSNTENEDVNFDGKDLWEEVKPDKNSISSQWYIF